MNTDHNKKYKRPKKQTPTTTNPESSTSRNTRSHDQKHPPEHVCPLLAKDSEWVDILQSSDAGPNRSSNGDAADNEEVLQLVNCEDGPQMRPLAIMFPGLLDKDPETLHGMLNKAMSTTEVTRQLVDLGQKANFAFMKKADRLLPPDKQWLEGVRENSSDRSLSSNAAASGCCTNNYEASDEISLSDSNLHKRKKKKPSGLPKSFFLRDEKQSEDSIDQERDTSRKR